MKQASKHQVRVTSAILLAVMSIVGCRDGSGEATNAQPTFQRQEVDQHVVMIVMDLSGSFAQKMAENGSAFDFATHVLDRYFRHRDALNDRIILAQISGTKRSLMWEGTPLELRREFPSAAEFREFLLSEADGGGSLVNDGVCNAIEYLAYHPRYGNGRSRSVTLILSDMDDTGSQRDSEQQLNSTLSAYGQINGSVGIYFCNQLRIEDWRQRLSRAGIDNFIVESEIVGKPPLPNFE